MTPSYLNLSSSPTTSDHDDDHYHPSIFSSDTCQAASSSSYIITTHNLFDSPSCQYQSEIYQQGDQQPQFQQDQADNFASHGAISYHVENECSENIGLKFSIWKNEENYENLDTSTCQIKWMSTKMRLKHKMKKDAETPTSNTINYTPIEDDQKQQQPSAHMETDESSNNNSSNSSMISNSTLIIRTCSDCNTTKTPLWRSGPQGPKSLCNACGIRQRKARRAMAAAAAANDTAAAFEKETTPPVLVIKNKKINNSKTKTKQQKDKTSNPCSTVVNVAKFKKQSCSLMTPGPHHHQVQKQVCMEEFLLTFSNNLACDYKVLPQDVKDAAILLMALSFDHVRRI